MNKIVFYISGHGFGHSVRIQEVMKILYKRDPYIRLIVKTDAPRWLFEQNISFPFIYEHMKPDVGVIQKDSLHVNRKLTLKKYSDFIKLSKPLLELELPYLRKLECDLIISDIPPFAFKLSSMAGIPSIGIGNFGWDWIYEDFIQEYPDYQYIVPEIQDSYSKCTLLLRLPFYGDMKAFPRIKDIPLITRKFSTEPNILRDRLGLPKKEKIVFLSFGGFDMNLIPDDALKKLYGKYFFISFIKLPSTLPNVLTIPREGFYHEDLVNLADIVMTKPGYGIVSECIAHKTPILYTSRGPFPEYEKLVEGLNDYATARFIPRDNFLKGNWGEHLDMLFQDPPHWVEIELNGAEIAADYIESFLK